MQQIACTQSLSHTRVTRDTRPRPCACANAFLWKPKVAFAFKTCETWSIWAPEVVLLIALSSLESWAVAASQSRRPCLCTEAEPGAVRLLRLACRSGKWDLWVSSCSIHQLQSESGWPRACNDVLPIVSTFPAADSIWKAPEVKEIRDPKRQKVITNWEKRAE